jgi:hypothetical protein
VRRLTAHRAKPGHLPHQPLQRYVSRATIFRQELAGLLGDVLKYRARFKNGVRPAAKGRIAVNDGRQFMVGIDHPELGREMLPFEDIVVDQPIRQFNLFKSDGNLLAIGRAGEVKVDHALNANFRPGRGQRHL